MKRILLLAAFVFSCISQLSAQAPTLPQKLKIGTPEVLKPDREGTYKMSDLEKELNKESKWGTKKMSRKYWVVWSDRDHNTVYSTADKNSRLDASFNFGDRAIIADIKDDMALVYIEDKAGVVWPEVSNKAKVIGWVPMDNLILWDRCPTNKYGIQKKALIAIHVNERKFDQKRYRSPDTNTAGENLSMDMEFYFIMKEDGRMTLLCRNPTIVGNGQNLFGWVDRGNYAEWEQRACLEPTWDRDYVAHNMNKEASVYIDPDLGSGTVLKWQYGTSNGDTDDPSCDYRMSPDLLRFPILEKINEQDKFAHCTVFSDASGRITNADPGTGREIDNFRDSKRVMNLIFVVEATPDMRGYLSALKETVEKCNRFSQSNLRVRVGLVLYRSNASGNVAIEKVPMSNCDDANLLSMLNDSKATGRWQGNKRTVALKKAIETASDPMQMGFSRKESNLMILVGNKGDAEDCDLTDATIVGRLSHNFIQMMSVQVVTASTGSAAVYNDQVESLMKANLKNQYTSIGGQYTQKRIRGNIGYTFESVENKENVLFSRTLYPAGDGDKWTGAEVSRHVSGGIGKFADTIENWLKLYEEELNKVGAGFSSQFLETYLGADLYNRYKKLKGISAFDGYVKLKDHEEQDQWHYIIYMSQDELAQLLENLKDTYHAASQGSDDRTKYRNAVRSLAKNITGQTDDRAIDRMPINELQKLIYGLNVQTGATGRDLEQITDISRTRGGVYQEILKEFANKYERLDGIYTKQYRYVKTIGENKYYWIPIEDLP